MKALVTGFEPFGGEGINPSSAALARLPSSLGPLIVATRTVPTVFGQALDALDRALAEHRPDIVLAVGQAGGRSALSLERVAINLDDAQIADNAGARPVDRPIVPGGPAGYFSTLPIKPALHALRAAGLPAAISDQAGTFVCNHLFYGLMHRAALAGNAWRGGFLHIPYLPQQAARHEGASSMALEHIVQGIEIILAVTAAAIEGG